MAENSDELSIRFTEFIVKKGKIKFNPCNFIKIVLS